jgi:hypothetical protein
MVNFPGAYRVLVELSLEMQYCYYLFIITVSVAVLQLPNCNRFEGSHKGRQLVVWSHQQADYSNLHLDMNILR